MHNKKALLCDLVDDTSADCSVKCSVHGESDLKHVCVPPKVRSILKSALLSLELEVEEWESGERGVVGPDFLSAQEARADADILRAFMEQIR